ncbi:DUF6086 family protein [Streptomyces sp. NPDC004111]|uniref:DUF6086 family protein n=1 Tax=Streptomyces sp. NPDC004111 TaxID=3364690 RepID=UPI0036BB6E55
MPEVRPAVHEECVRDLVARHRHTRNAVFPTLREGLAATAAALARRAGTGPDMATDGSGSAAVAAPDTRARDVQRRMPG